VITERNSANIHPALNTQQARLTWLYADRNDMSSTISVRSF